MYPEVVLASQQISATEQQRNTKIKPLYLIPTSNEYEIIKTKKRRKNKCFNFLTKCPELKIQNDTSSYHDCIGLHFPGVEVGIINNNGGYAIPHCFSCCNTMLYNSEQHATITEGRVYSIFCYFYYRMSSLHNFNTTYFRTHYQKFSFSWNLGRLHSGILFEGKTWQNFRLSSFHKFFSFCRSYNLCAQEDFPGAWKGICHLFSGSTHELPPGSQDWIHRHHLPWRKNHPCWKSGLWESRVAIVWRVGKQRLFYDHAFSYYKSFPSISNI